MKTKIFAIALLALPFVTGSSLFAGQASAAAMSGKLGDLSSYHTIIADVQAIAAKGDFVAAEKRITDFETAWDNAAKAMRPLSKTQWGNVDDAADAALEALRASAPEAATVTTTLATLIAEIDDPKLAP
jgi:hypothetical protein